MALWCRCKLGKTARRACIAHTCGCSPFSLVNGVRRLTFVCVYDWSIRADLCFLKGKTENAQRYIIMDLEKDSKICFIVIVRTNLMSEK